MSKSIAIMFVFESESNPSRVYQTLQYTDGTTSCDCRGWTQRFVGGVRTCRHVRLVESGCAGTTCKTLKKYTSDPIRMPLNAASVWPERKPAQPVTMTSTKRNRKFDFST